MSEDPEALNVELESCLNELGFSNIHPGTRYIFRCDGGITIGVVSSVAIGFSTKDIVVYASLNSWFRYFRKRVGDGMWEAGLTETSKNSTNTLQGTLSFFND